MCLSKGLRLRIVTPGEVKHAVYCTQLESTIRTSTSKRPTAHLPADLLK